MRVMWLKVSIKEELPIGHDLRGATIASSKTVDGNDNNNTLMTF